MMEIGPVRFERELIVLCDCAKHEVDPGDLNLTGVRVVLRREPGAKPPDLVGTCRLCGTRYAVGLQIERTPGEAREALEAARAP